MDTGEKITALENIIFQFANKQFALNQISPAQALVVMKCVKNRFQEIFINTDLMNRVSIQQTEAAGNNANTPRDTRRNPHYVPKNQSEEQDAGEEGKNDNP